MQSVHLHYVIRLISTMAVYTFFFVLYTPAGDRESVTRTSAK